MVKLYNRYKWYRECTNSGGHAHGHENPAQRHPQQSGSELRQDVVELAHVAAHLEAWRLRAMGQA